MPKSNRWKIYAAERDAGLNNGPGGTPEGIQAWYDWAIKTKWWQANSAVRHVRVVYPAVGKMSGVIKFFGEGERRIVEVHYGVWSMTEGGTMHESTHMMKGMLIEGADDDRDHLQAFATMYLRVVKRYMGIWHATRLEEQFGIHKVAWDRGWRDLG